MSKWLSSKTQAIAHAGEDGQQGDHFSIAGETANLYNHSGNQFGGFSENWEIALPKDVAIPLLEMYPKGTPPNHKDTFSNILMAALFVIVRN